MRGRVHDDQAWFATIGLELISTGIDTEHNQILVGLLGVTNSSSDLVRARYGDGVAVRNDDYSVSDTCTVNSCWPQKGGIRLCNLSGATVICTSGFTVRYGNPIQYGLLTAGHCVHLGGFGDWAHDTSAHKIGTPTPHTYSANSNADAVVITMNHSTPPTNTLNSFVFEDNVIQYVGQVAPQSWQVQGSPVCMSGWGTRNGPPVTVGRKCGLITVPDVFRPSCLDANKTNCVQINHQWEMSFDTTGGDSGGPISQGCCSAVGLLTDSVKNGTGERSWYSPLTWAMSTIDAVPGGVRWRVCLNATCTSYW